MEKIILGLDIGITSVGWGVINSERKILGAGVRLFEEADAKKNLSRRTHRGIRRLKRRQKERINDLKNLFVELDLIGVDFQPLGNPYELRAKGVENKLNPQELATALLHIVKRRGSSLETVDNEHTKNEESPKFILNKHDYLLKKYKFVSKVQLSKLIEEGHVRGSENIFRLKDYVIEAVAILQNQDFNEETKNRIIKIISRKRHYSEGPGNWFSSSPYGRFRTVEGEELQSVIQYIKEKQQEKFGKQKFSIEFLDKQYTVLKSGEVINKKGLNLIDLMRGYCSLYPDELRAPKCSFSAELFNLLNDLNNISITSRENKKVTKEEKEQIIFQIISNGGFKPKGVKGLAKVLGCRYEDIEGLRIGTKETKIITEFTGYKKIFNVIQDKQMPEDVDKLDKIAEILTKTQVVEERIKELSTLLANQLDVHAISELTGFSGYHSFSFKAIKQLNHEMLVTNLNQQQIITSSQLKINRFETKLNFDEKLILSPVAKRSHREALKVVEALTKEFGNFDRIVIETTRDKNSSEQKKNIVKQQQEIKRNKDEAEQLILDSGYNDAITKGQIVLKLRLFKEQNGRCAYTNNPIDIHRLITDENAYEIDHIIPYSISLDNSYSNKVLVLPLANQLKGNQTPFGYFMSGKAKDSFNVRDFSSFKSIVESNNNYGYKKKKYLIAESTMDKFDDMEEFINRNLNDTSYAIRSIMTTLKNYFASNEIPTTVVTIKGKQTSVFRGIAIHEWNKNHSKNSSVENPMIKNRDHYMHHAIDALIIAGLSQQKLFSYLYGLENTKENIVYHKHTGELLNLNPLEDSALIRYLKDVSNIQSSDIRFSWKKDTKLNRSFSDETIYSTRLVEGKHIVVKKYKDIYSMKSADALKIFEDETKKKKLLVYINNRQTYDILESIYYQYKHEIYPFAAFKKLHGDVKKYAKEGNGPSVTSLKYYEDELGNHIDISNKYNTNKKKVVLLQIPTYRIDIYKNYVGDFKFVTVRYNDFKAIDGHMAIDKTHYQLLMDRKKIDQEYKFKFSLYRNDIFSITKLDKNKNPISNTYRFISTNNDKNNLIEFKPVVFSTSKQVISTIGKTIINMEKYNVSPSGVKSKVVNEVLLLSV